MVFGIYTIVLLSGTKLILSVNIVTQVAVFKLGEAYVFLIEHN